MRAASTCARRSTHYGRDSGRRCCPQVRGGRCGYSSLRRGCQGVHARLVAADLQSATIDLSAVVEAQPVKTGLRSRVQLIDPQGRPVADNTQPVPADWGGSLRHPVAAPMLVVARASTGAASFIACR